MMEVNSVAIEDTFAEAFPMTGCRLTVTAADRHWVETVARVTTGYACSVIGCDVEAGVERWLDPSETPDGRPGVDLLFFAFSRDALQKAMVNRVGQCIMTCPTTACYNGIAGAEKTINIGGQLRFFGDGYQISKLLDGDRYWRVPCMDGEFICQETFGVVKGVAGGNFLIIGKSQASALAAARSAVEAINSLPEVILPFPGGIVRAGSKVGSKYKALKASTNDSYCPTLRGLTESRLPEGANAVYELVIDGLSLEAVETAMRVGIRAACQEGVLKITAGNYGGTLGPHHLHLHRVLPEPTPSLAT